MTIDEAYQDFVNPLKNIYEDREASGIADWVFERITGINRLDRITHKFKELNISTAQLLNDKLIRLLNHVPVQYVLNEAWFYKMKFYVDEHVLIPRPETEELVEWIIDDVRCKAFGIRPRKIQNSEHHASGVLDIIDIGTGSGCIAIALKKEIQAAEISSLDSSEAALDVAKRNAADQQVKIDFILLDFLDENIWSRFSLFDIIVSNPPYIPVKEKTSLDKNVVHEPHLALFVDNDDPFIFYKKIILFAGSHLKQDGKIYVEVHEEYAGKVSKIFLQHDFTSIIKKDLHGRERMICAYR